MVSSVNAQSFRYLYDQIRYDLWENLFLVNVLIWVIPYVPLRFSPNCEEKFVLFINTFVKKTVRNIFRFKKKTSFNNSKFTKI